MSEEEPAQAQAEKAQTKPVPTNGKDDVSDVSKFIFNLGTIFGVEPMSESLVSEQFANVSRKQAIGRMASQLGVSAKQFVDHANLRALAGSVWVQRCTSLIINEVLSFPYEIVPTNPLDDSAKTADLIEEITQFFETVNANEESLKEVLRKGIYDLLTLDQGVIVKNFDPRAYKALETESAQTTIQYVPLDAPAGLLKELFAVDGATFVKQVDANGVVIGYWQLNPFRGKIEFFSNREIVWIARHDTTYSLYGWSPLQSVKQVVESLVRIVENVEKFHDKGDIPQGIIAIFGSLEQFETFRDMWKSEVEGQPYKLPVVGADSEGDLKFIPLTFSRKEIMLLDELEFFQRIVMSAFLITPSELGLTDTVNKAVGYEQKHVMRRATIKPLLKHLEELINREIIPEFDDEKRVQFRWIIDEEAEEELRKQSVISQKLRSGLITVNEVRTELGLDPVPWGNAPFDLNIWLQEAIQRDPELFGLPDYEVVETPGQEEPSDENNDEDSQQGDELDEENIEEQEDDEGEEAKPDDPNAQDQRKFAKKIEAWLKKALVEKTITSERKQIMRVLRQRFPRWSYQKLNYYADLLEKQGIAPALSSDELLPSSFYISEWRPKERVAKNKHRSKPKTVKKKRRNVAKIENRSELLRRALRGIKTLVLAFSRAIRRKIAQLRQELGIDKKLATRYASMDEEQAYIRIRDDPDIRQFVQRVEQELQDVLDEFLDKALVLGVSLVIDENGKPVIQELPDVFDVVDEDAVKILETRKLLVADSVSFDIEQQLRYEIIEGIKAGEGIPKIARRISRVADVPTKRAQTIARTEVLFASNLSKQRAMERAGIKEWIFLAWRDERVCPICEPLHGTEYSIKDLENRPPIHPNCRCTMIAKIEGLENPQSTPTAPIPAESALPIVVEVAETARSYASQGELERSKRLFSALASLLRSVLRIHESVSDEAILREFAKYYDAWAEKAKESAKKKKRCERRRNESVDDCVSRKIPIILEENPRMSREQAVAIAYSLCDCEPEEKTEGGK